MRVYVSAVLVSLALMINLAVSTQHYNTHDPRMQELHQQFARGEYGDMDCGLTEQEAYDGVQLETCSGGIIERRDAYLRSQHVWGIGKWYTDSNCACDQSTFRLYFRYWF